MRFLLKIISHAVDRLVVNIENSTKGRARHSSPKLDLSEHNLPDYFQSPEKFYSLGTAMPEIRTTPERTLGGVAVTRYSFQSATASGHPENDVVVGRIFEVRNAVHGEAAPCAIIAHGWRETGAFAFYYSLLCWILARLGINCIMFNQPYHGPRAPRGVHDGDLMICCADLEQTVRAFRQSVCDIRSLITWAASRFSGPVGVVGISLGGFISLLVTCADDRIKFAVPVIAAGDITENLDKSAVGKSVARDLRDNGVTLDQLVAAWRIIMPINLRPKIPADSIQLIAGEFDLLIPIENVDKLERAWNIAHVRRLPCGHITIGLFPRVLVSTIADFIRNIR